MAKKTRYAVVGVPEKEDAVRRVVWSHVDRRSAKRCARQLRQQGIPARVELRAVITVEDADSDAARRYIRAELDYGVGSTGGA